MSELGFGTQEETTVLATLKDGVLHLTSAAWQPIKTAPKDGTRVLLWCALGGEGAVGTGYMLGGVWVASVGVGILPTHWMPIPDPPPPSSSE